MNDTYFIRRGGAFWTDIFILTCRYSLTTNINTFKHSFVFHVSNFYFTTYYSSLQCKRIRNKNKNNVKTIKFGLYIHIYHIYSKHFYFTNQNYVNRFYILLTKHFIKICKPYISVVYRKIANKYIIIKNFVSLDINIYFVVRINIIIYWNFDMVLHFLWYVLSWVNYRRNRPLKCINSFLANSILNSQCKYW